MYKNINFNIFKTLFISFLVFLNVSNSYSIGGWAKNIFNKAQESAKRMKNAISGNEPKIVKNIISAVKNRNIDALEEILKDPKTCDALCAAGSLLDALNLPLSQIKDKDLQMKIVKALSHCKCDQKKDPKAFKALETLKSKYLPNE